jgi:two-component system, OmpR family, sensor histidine kinase KdpD
VQAEQLRNSLLSSVSHDLRTPLATIAGTASSLLETASEEDQQQREMLQAVVDESSRLSRLVDNLLDMARLDSGSVVPNRQWHVFEELVGSALGSLKRELKRHRVQVQIPRDLPLVHVDGVLMEQVLVNLLENASRYTPGGTKIDISAQQHGNRVEIHVADDGPGLPPGSESKIFDKFFRGTTIAADGRRGVGLGLTICQAILQAHGGRITAANRLQGGAEFVISLPHEQQPPAVAMDEVSVHAGA